MLLDFVYELFIIRIKPVSNIGTERLSNGDYVTNTHLPWVGLQLIIYAFLPFAHELFYKLVFHT